MSALCRRLCRQCCHEGCQGRAEEVQALPRMLLLEYCCSSRRKATSSAPAGKVALLAQHALCLLEQVPGPHWLSELHSLQLIYDDATIAQVCLPACSQTYSNRHELSHPPASSAFWISSIKMPGPSG